MVYYIYMVPPPQKNCSFTIFTGIYGVFWHILGDIFNVFKIKLDIVSRGRTVYIYMYNRGCRQTRETWWFWHQEVLGGPRTSLEPRTKNQDCTESLGGILVVYLQEYQFLHCLYVSLSSFVFSRLHSFNNILFVQILFMI